MSRRPTGVRSGVRSGVRAGFITVSLFVLLNGPDVFRFPEALEDRSMLASDYGDAPDTGVGTGAGNYETLLASGGASHTIDTSQTTLFLGISVDSETGILQNARANADDVDGALPDDEGGVLNPLDLRGTIGAAPVVTLLVTNTTGSAATLAGWIDYDNDGVFENATERATATVNSGTTNGRVRLTLPAVPEGFTGTTYARFRLSTDAGFAADASSVGSLSDGEVEDYTFSITSPSGSGVDRFLKIAHELNGGPTLNDQDRFGSSVSSLGDLDGDGVADLAVGVYRDDTGGSDRGAVYVLFLNADGTVKSSTKIAHETGGGPTLSNSDGFGSSVSGVGDLNGDGVADLAVGANGDGTGGNYRGAVHVLLMNADGTVNHSTKIAHKSGGGPTLEDWDRFGFSVSGVGDLDGDGIGDLAVGARGDNTGITDRGAVHVLLLHGDGKVKRSMKIAHETGGGPTLADRAAFGSSVSGVGDLDGDGVADLAVGAPNDVTGGQLRGAVYVLLMNHNGTAKSSTKIASDTSGGPTLADIDLFGFSVSGVGDLDGDGVADLAVGATYDDTGGKNRGTVYVLLLNTDGTVKSSMKIAHQLNGGPTLLDWDTFGRSVSGVGDLDGDGEADLAVGAHGDDTGGPRRGAVYILNLIRPVDHGDAPDTGAGSGTGNYQTTQVDGGPSHTVVAGLFLGDTVDGKENGTLQNAGANADDVDGALPDDEDGVLNPLELRGTIGAAPTVTLLVTNTTSTAATLSGWIDYDNDGVFENPTERATATVSSGTTDGRVTLTFPSIPTGFSGATYARFRLSTDAGFVADPSSVGALADGEVEDYTFTITSRSTGTVDSFTKIAHELNGGPTLADRDRFGSSVFGVGDLDGDGVADLAVGARRDRTGGLEGGAVYVALLNADGTVKSSKKIAHETGGGPTLVGGDNFGSSVSSVGDLDGDGVADLAVGARADGTGGLHRGAVHVLLLNADGTVKNSTKIAHQLNGGPTLANLDFFGTSVSSVGDLDGDGVIDLAVGASGDNTGGYNRGAVHVLLLKADGTVKSSTKIASDTGGGPTLVGGDYFGSSVFGVGDLDGDGVADLAVGARFDRTGGLDRGAVHVLLLNADGTVKSSTKIGHETGGGPTLADGDNFGSSVSGVGDLDGDGVADLAVGAWEDDTGGLRRGAVHVLLKSDGVVKSSTKIAHETGGGPTLSDLDWFGGSVSGVGDLDGNGVADLAVGATGDDTGGTLFGAVHVLFLSRASFTLSKTEATVSEDGTTTTDSLTVTLDGQPASDVVLDLLLSSNPDAAIDKTSLTFTNANWNQPQTVTITGLDDDVVDGDEQTTVTVSVNSTASDDFFDFMADQIVTVTTTDDDTAGFTLSKSSATVSEDGTTVTDSFTIALDAQPVNDVAVDLSVSSNPDAIVDKTSFTFTNANWNQPQTVIVTGVNDDIDDGDQQTTITVSVNDAASDDVFDPLADQTVTVTTTDDDTRDVAVSIISGNTSEAGATATFTVALQSEPTADVLIGLTSSDTSEGTVAPAGLTFTPANWESAQTVTVTGVDDDIDDGDVGFSIVTAAATGGDYAGVNPVDVAVTNEDDDTHGVTVSAISGNTTEAGATATFTVALDSEPTADVLIGLTSSDTSEGTVAPAVLTFTPANWESAQTVTVTGIDDNIDDGDVGFSIVTTAATGGDYVGVDPVDVAVTNEDDDTHGVTVSAISGNTTEAGATATFTVALDSEPTADVLIGLTSSDTTEGTVAPAGLTFTPANWESAQTVTVTGVDDDIDDGDVGFSIVTAAATGGDYAGVNPVDVAVTNEDDDTHGVTVSAISGNTTEAGATATFTVALDSEPTADVLVGLTSSDTSEGTVVPAVLTFTPANWESAQTVTVTGIDDNIDDGDVGFSIVTAAATGGDYVGVNPADVAVTNDDDDTRGVTVSTISGNTTEAGGTATFTVALDSEPTADVLIGLTSSDATEGTVAPAMLTFTPANWSLAQTATVTGVDDNIDDDHVAFSIVTAAATGGDYAGIDSVDVAVTNDDDDTVGVTVSTISGHTTESGDTATFTVVLESEPTADVLIGLTSSDTTEGNVAPAMLTFTSTNWDSAQTVTVTGVNDDMADGNVAFSIVTAAATGGDYAGNNPNDVNVVNNDNDIATLAVTINATLINEGDGNAATTGTVTRNTETTDALTVMLHSSDTSEAIVPATVTIPAGQGNANFNIDAVNDFEPDGTQAVTVTASVDGFSGGEGFLNVTDDEPGQLDVDEDTLANAATDGILVIRHLFGFTGDALVANAVGSGANLQSGSEIAAKLSGSQGMLDADGDGVLNAATDGILVIRYLFGFTGDALVNNATGTGATRNTGDAVRAYLDLFLPASSSSLQHDGGASTGVTDEGGDLEIQSFGLATDRPLFTWNTVPQADTYRVEIVNLETGATVNSLSTTSPNFTADRFATGQYRIWVKAISADGKQILLSGWQEFTVASTQELDALIIEELNTGLLYWESDREWITPPTTVRDNAVSNIAEAADERAIDRVMANASSDSWLDTRFDATDQPGSSERENYDDVNAATPGTWIKNDW